MIDEAATFDKYGYYSTDWKPKSHKKIVAICDICGAIRYPMKCSYRDLCQQCSNQTAEHRKAVRDGNRGKIRSAESRANMSKAGKDRVLTDEHKRKLGDAHRGKKYPPYTEERRQHMSAGQQGIPYEQWDGFVKAGTYCEKFDEACRERIRAKYDYRCYICDKPQHENISKNGNVRKLGVHHVDKNKDQGCDGIQWKLVPLCMTCHSKSHFDPMKSRIDYLVRAE